MRRLSAFLEVFGFEMRQATGWPEALGALEAGPAECVILDAGGSIRQAFPWCGQLRDKTARDHVHVLMLVDEPGPRALTEALEAGADDFLTRPIVFGEVLARLRSAARAVEFERRLREQSDVEPITGMPSRAVLLEHLARAVGRAGQGGASSCVLLDIDFLDAVNRRHGRPEGDRLIRAVGEKLAAMPAPWIASLGAGRFAAVLADASEEDAAAWADSIRQTIATTEFNLGGADRPVRLSGAVVPVRAELSAQQNLDKATDALRWAKHSGRNVVVRSGQFAEESQAWNELVSQGRLFEGTIARDVMTPCTLVLGVDDPLDRAAALFARSRLEILPVVDGQGRLAGVLENAAIVGMSPADAASPVGALMETAPLARDEETPFDELMEFFRQQPAARLVIQRDGRPTGLVTANSLLALSVPLGSESFAPAEPFSTTSDFLLVPDLTVADEA